MRNAAVLLLSFSVVRCIARVTIEAGLQLTVNSDLSVQTSTVQNNVRF